MQFIDTHTHLFLNQFEQDIDEVLYRARENGISNFLLPNIDSESISGLFELSERKTCHPMLGLHPCSVKENFRDELEIIDDAIKDYDSYKYGSLIGVGEIGLDYFWDLTFKEQQIKAYKIQLEWSVELKLPVSIHSRDSLDDTIKYVSELQNGNLSGVFHCFTGTVEQAKQIIDLGFYLGIGGVVTFKNSGLDKVLSELPLTKMVLETDSPYLAPTPYRGKRNESSYIKYTAEKMAEVLQVDIIEVGKTTTENAKSIFKL